MQRTIFAAFFSFFCFSAIAADTTNESLPKPLCTITLTNNDQTQEIEIVHELYAQQKPQIDEFIKTCGAALTPEELTELANLLYRSYEFTRWDSKTRTCGTAFVQLALHAYQTIQDQPIQNSAAMKQLENAGSAITSLLAIRYQCYTAWISCLLHIEQKGSQDLKSLVGALQQHIRTPLAKHIADHKAVIATVAEQAGQTWEQAGQALCSAAHQCKDVSGKNASVEGLDVLSMLIDNLTPTIDKQCTASIEQSTAIAELANGMQTLSAPFFLMYYAALHDHMQGKGLAPIASLRESAEEKESLPTAHSEFATSATDKKSN